MTDALTTRSPDDENSHLNTLLGLLVPEDSDKDHKSRLQQFGVWLYSTQRSWTAPDLAAYRDMLMERGLGPSSIQAHLATIRGRYARLLRNPQAREALYSAAYQQLVEDGQAETPANAKAYVDEAVARLEAALHPENAPVTVIKQLDVAQGDHLRLTAEQASTLLALPDTSTLKGIRDTALMAMMLCTGIREAELCAIQVDDLRQRLGNVLALRVRRGKGARERLIPYGSLDWALVIVETWLQRAGIDDQTVFRSFFKSEKVRPRALTTRAVQLILADYPVVVDGRLVVVRPHDLRRTYARRLYDAGVDLVAIQQNLGHAHLKTTLVYIGDLGAEQRQPPVLYRFDLARLKR